MRIVPFAVSCLAAVSLTGALAQDAGPAAAPQAKAKLMVVPKPDGATLKVPDGFVAQEFVGGLSAPRMVRVAPNGDIFVADTGGKIQVFRAADGAAKPTESKIFAESPDKPFGMAFYPAGPNPKWLYVANANSVFRYPYGNGDLVARAAPQTLVGKLYDGGLGEHVTRDIVFSKDGRHMFVSVGSSTDAGEGMAVKSPAEAHAWDRANALGAAWGEETARADILQFDPDGSHRKIFATGLRNCVGMAIHPATGDLWCSVNERDSAKDEVIGDFITRVKPASFFGWPWYYPGNHEDLRHLGERPDLKDKITTPDIMIQPHPAALTMAIYGKPASGAAAFPAGYRGDVFVALHGSVHDGKLSGAKIVRIHLNKGVPVGQPEDFATGFAVGATTLWGRPVGVAMAHDGALLITDDAGGSIWRVAYGGN